MLDTQKALKTPKTDEYYENYDRIFGKEKKDDENDGGEHEGTFRKICEGK